FKAFNLLEENQKKALLAFYVIFSHHGQLTNFSEIATRLGRDLNSIIDEQQENLKQYFEFIDKDLGIDNLTKSIFYCDVRKIRRGFRLWEKKEASVQDYFLINYSFSLLVEEDKLDASDTLPYSLKSIKLDSVYERFGKVSVKNYNFTDL